MRYIVSIALLAALMVIPRSVVAQSTDPAVRAIERADYVTARRILEPLAALGEPSAYFNLGIVALGESDSAPKPAQARLLAEAYAYFYAAAGLGDADAPAELTALERRISAAAVTAGKKQGQQFLTRHRDGAVGPPPSSSPPTSAVVVQPPTSIAASAPAQRGTAMTRWIELLGSSRVCALEMLRVREDVVAPEGSLLPEEVPLIRRHLEECPGATSQLVVTRLATSGSSGTALLLTFLLSPFPDARLRGVAPLVGTSLGGRLTSLGDSAWRILDREADRSAQAGMLRAVSAAYVPAHQVETLFGLCRRSWSASRSALEEFRRPTSMIGGRILRDPAAPVTLRCAELLIDLPFTGVWDRAMSDWYGQVLVAEYRGSVDERFRWNDVARRIIARLGAATRPWIDHIVNLTEDGRRDPALAALIATTHPDYLKDIRSTLDERRLALFAFFGAAGIPELIRWIDACKDANGLDMRTNGRCGVILATAASNAPVTRELVDAFTRASNGRNPQIHSAARRGLDDMRRRAGGS